MPLSSLVPYGPLDCEPLIETVQALPESVWTYRTDPESDRTRTVRENSEHFPMAEVEALLEQARQKYLGPGFSNRMVLSCVPAGEQILPHTDDFGAHVRKHSRHCHIPLITDERVVMGFADNTVEMHMTAGRLYHMDETVSHYVRNPSELDRVHLLFAHWPQPKEQDDENEI